MAVLGTLLFDLFVYYLATWLYGSATHRSAGRHRGHRAVLKLNAASGSAGLKLRAVWSTWVSSRSAWDEAPEAPHFFASRQPSSRPRSFRGDSRMQVGSLALAAHLLSSPLLCSPATDAAISGVAPMRSTTYVQGYSGPFMVIQRGSPVAVS